MNRHRALLPGVAALLSVAMMALGFGRAALAGSDAGAAPTTAVLVPIEGTVDGEPEAVEFSGQARLGVSVVPDPDFGATPTVRLSIDLSKVVGVGASSGQTYITHAREIVERPLADADSVQISFPFATREQALSEARVGEASFDLDFNIETGKLKRARAKVTGY
jgi:hypothetical protein